MLNMKLLELVKCSSFDVSLYSWKKKSFASPDFKRKSLQKKWKIQKSTEKKKIINYQ